MLRTRTVWADQKLEVTAVESLEFRIDKANHGRFITGGLKPVAVIVREADRTYAFDMDGHPADID
jgi:hypothetical protein